MRSLLPHRPLHTRQPDIYTDKCYSFPSYGERGKNTLIMADGEIETSDESCNENLISPDAAKEQLNPT